VVKDHHLGDRKWGREKKEGQERGDNVRRCDGREERGGHSDNFQVRSGNTVLRCAAPYLASLSDGEESLQAVNALV
jgi:hypothetical protein